MELLKLALREHKGLLVLAAAALALIVAFSAVRCTSLQAQRTQEEQQAAEQGGGSAPVNDGGKDSVEDTALAKLTDEQRKRQSSYDDQTAAFVSELASNIWTARNDRYFLSFTPTTFTDYADGEKTVRPYVVSNLTLRSPSTSGGNTTEVKEAVLETDEGPFVLTYTLVTEKEGGKATAKIASGAFSIAEQDGYTRTAASDNALEVEGVNDDFAKMVGGETDKLEKALREFCAANIPTATKASWRGVAERDWKEKTVATWFDLNNSGKSSVSVTYDAEKGEFTVKNSYSASERS